MTPEQDMISKEEYLSLISTLVIVILLKRNKRRKRLKMVNASGLKEIDFYKRM